MSGHRPPKRVTMADIARIAGVSPSTVSRALGDHPLVDARTRERVREIARQHNYEVNVGARNFRLRRSRTLALAVPPAGSDRVFVEYLSGRLVAAVTDAAEGAGYALQLVAGGDTQARYTAMLDACRADGIVALPGAIDYATLETLVASDSPVVAWGHAGIPAGVCTVNPDLESAAEAAAEHLRADARRHALVLSTDWFGTAGRYPVACREALEQRGIGATRLTLGDAIAGDTRARLADALAGTDIDAIVASNDLLALAAVQSLRAQGRAVPGDVAVTGFGDCPLASHLSPGLTTFDPGVEEVGALMVERLVALIEEGTCEPATVTPRLVLRETTSASASDGDAPSPHASASGSAVSPDGSSGRM